VILEFSMPDISLLRWVYGLYFHRVMPWVATLISRDRNNAYRYLAHSVASFVSRGEMSRQLRDAGFGSVRVIPMTLGVVVAYLAKKGS
jgi:demethylmenaquinone methyltransferase/2-methoxy-6-polyprenyl-1,4-benzoquinol methylase